MSEFVELTCPNCGEPQMLPPEERDGESEYSVNYCDQCNQYPDEEPEP